MRNDSPSPTAIPDREQRINIYPRNREHPTSKKTGVGWRPGAHLKQRDTASAVHEGVNAPAIPEATNSVNLISDKTEQEGGKKKGSWVLVAWVLAQAPRFISGVGRQVPPLRYSILGTVRMKASTHHRHTEHNSPDPACLSSPESGRHSSMFKLTCSSY